MDPTRAGNESARFAAALFAFEDALDWPRLERLYCDGDAEGFFGEERRDELREAGLLVADELGARLTESPAAGSVYLGGSVAELVPWLCEVVVLQRDARLVNRGDERELLEAARRAAAERCEVALPPVLDAVDGAPEELGHLWVVSVLTDPVAFPALHDHLYERPGAANTAGTTTLDADRDRALALLAPLAARCPGGASVTTTEEELELLEVSFRAAGRTLTVEGAGPLTALVGDRIVWARVS